MHFDHKGIYRIVFIILCLCVLPSGLTAEDRFPQPEFKSNYQTPITTTPLPRDLLFEYLDVAVLLLCLLAASYLVLKKRSRNGILILSIFCVLYFGFWRKGCVCAVGSLQNICLALFHSSYAIPLTVILFFVLPLVFALFTGRTFCAAVCPLGALQELAAVKPRQIPVWLNKGLSLLPILYLTLAMLFACTGTEFIICRFDPFIGFYRFGATMEMIVFGLVLLAGGVFIARPYCRFLCPYGVLLGAASLLARRHAAITPDECIQCRLCADTCPVGAIKPATPSEQIEDKQKGIRRLAVLLILMPLLAVACGFMLCALAPWFSQAHLTVQTARQVKLEDAGLTGTTTLESDTFRASGKTLAALNSEAEAIEKSFVTWGWILGIGLGLGIGLKLISFSTWKKQADFTPDHLSCVSCCRCFASCPREQVRLQKVKEKVKKR